MNLHTSPNRTAFGRYVWYLRFALTSFLLMLVNWVNYTDSGAVLLERRHKDGSGEFFGLGHGNPAALIDATLQQLADKYPDETIMRERS